MNYLKYAFTTAIGASYFSLFSTQVQAEGLYADCVSQDKTRAAYTFIDRGNHTGTDRQSIFLSENSDGFTDLENIEHHKYFIFNSLQHMPLDLVQKTLDDFCQTGKVPSHQELSTDPDFGIDTEIAHCRYDDKAISFHNDPVNGFFNLTYQFEQSEPVSIGKNEGIVLNQRAASDAIEEFCSKGTLPIPLIN